MNRISIAYSHISFIQSCAIEIGDRDDTIIVTQSDSNDQTEPIENIHASDSVEVKKFNTFNVCIFFCWLIDKS